MMTPTEQILIRFFFMFRLTLLFGDILARSSVLGAARPLTRLTASLQFTAPRVNPQLTCSPNRHSRSSFSPRTSRKVLSDIKSNFFHISSLMMTVCLGRLRLHSPREKKFAPSLSSVGSESGESGNLFLFHPSFRFIFAPQPMDSLVVCSAK